MFLSKVLPDVLAPGDGGPLALDHILRAVRCHLGMDVGFISEFLDGRRVFRHVEATEGKGFIKVGGSDPLEESYCDAVVKGQLPRLIQDAADHRFAAAMPVTRELPVGAHLSVPIRLRDGRVYGTFCCFSSRPDRSLTDRDLATIEAFAQVAAAQIQHGIDSSLAEEIKRSRIASVLRTRDLHMVYQPAFHLGRGSVQFVEALARFYARPYRAPDEWFRSAAEVGLGVELELLAISRALEDMGKLPTGASLSINASPDVIVTEGFAAAMDGVVLDRLIIEITEHEMVTRYSSLNRALQAFRGRGLRVAVDDMGAGFSSFRHILQLRPDIIKLDISLPQDIDSDPARRALASALVFFAREIGSELVAEGVETDAQLETLRSLGITTVQGFLLQRPGPLADLGARCLPT